MGVVTRGMGATGCFGGACEGARADPACGAAARASGQELGKATVGHEIGVPSVARAQRAGAGASAKRGALVRAEGDERYKSIRRRVAATEETTIHDLPVRLSSAVSPSQPHPCFSLILSTRTALDPARVLHALTEPAPRDPRHAAPQDHLLEVVFGHLAADSKPREYFDATLTCVPSRAFSTLRLATRETRALLSELSFRETASVSSNLCVFTNLCVFAFTRESPSLRDAPSAPTTDARVSSSSRHPACPRRCSRFRVAAASKHALSNADESLLDIRASQWFAGARAFAEKAVAAGSARAAFFVGVVDFYCEGSDASSNAKRDAENADDAGDASAGPSAARDARRARGAALLARAATAGVREAHHTLAVMHFNGSGGGRRDKDPEAGAALCARGNILFDCVSAKRELGHCLQDGFGVEQDAALGAKLLAEAEAAEARAGRGLDAAVLAASSAAAVAEERLRKRNDINTLNAAVAAAAEVAEAAKSAAQEHLTATPENRFLLDWYGEKTAKDTGEDVAAACHASLPAGTTKCSHPLCGRVETRRHEFRRCSCCGRVRYCSRSCQAADWRLQHKFACLPLLELYGWAESDAESAEDEAGAPEGTPLLAQPCV